MAKPKTRKQGDPEATQEMPEAEVVVETTEGALDEAADQPEVAPVVAEEPVAADPDESAEPAASEEMSSEPDMPAPAAKRPGVFWPMLLGGIGAAALGAGAAIFALPQLPPALSARLLPPVVDAGAEAMAAVEAQSARLAGLEQQLSALSSGQEETQSLSAQIAALADRLVVLEGRPVAAEAAAGADPAALEALRAQVQQMQVQVAGFEQQRVDVAAELEAAKAQAAAAQTEAEAAALKTQVQANLAWLQAAFESGQPLAPALSDLAADGVSVPAALQGDVPRLAALREAFSEAAPKALRAARLADSGETLTDRIGTFLLAQTGARSLEAQEGDGPDAILSRAQAALEAGDLAGALGQIGALPDAAQAVLADWAVLARARLAAQEALAGLSETLN
jgi:hypothetical protein